MSNYFINSPLTKIIQNKLEENKESKKKSKSQFKFINAPDIITQVNPSYLNNFVKPINRQELSLTPSNHSNKLNNKEDYLLPPKSEENMSKKTLILDLDETLVHSSFTPFNKNDVVLKVDFDGIIYNIYVLIRPYAEEFLKNVSKYFETVIFTASLSKYASPLLDKLDKGKNIKYRLYREHCTYINGIFVKDLKRLNRNLKDIIIVDNSPLAYSFDIKNGLPIKSWYDDPKDDELMKIESIIIFLSKTKDVRKYIDQFVNDNEILYSEAKEIIDRFENDGIEVTEEDDKNNNNENNNKFKSSQNTINKISNIKFGSFSFNSLARIKTTGENNEKNTSPNMLNNSNDNKIIEIKQRNRFLKNKFESNNESDNKKVNTKKKHNVEILFRQKSSKKKNIFILNTKTKEQTLNIKINKNNGFNKNIQTKSFYHNYNTLNSLVLPFSNESKNEIYPKKTFINNTNIIPIHKINNKENKRKEKYVNLIEKFENNCKMKKKEIKTNFVFPRESENIKISSSITNHQNYFNQNSFKEKSGFLKIAKSNSISDVSRFNYLGNKNITQKHIFAKTPNRNLVSIIGKENRNNIKFNQKLENKKILYNFINGIGFSKIGRSKYTNSARPHNKRNYSKKSPIKSI